MNTKQRRRVLERINELGHEGHFNETEVRGHTPEILKEYAALIELRIFFSIQGDARRNNVPIDAILFALALLFVRMRAKIGDEKKDIAALASWLEKMASPVAITPKWREMTIECLISLLTQLVKENALT